MLAAWDGGAGAPRWFPEEYGWVVGCDYQGLPPDGGLLRNPIGASMALRRDLFAKVGGFSELVGRVGALPVGCEETEWCIRLRQTLPDSVIVRDTASVVHHRVPVARQRVGYFVRRCFYEGRSKAVLTDLVGTEDGLSAERRYVLEALSGGLARHSRAVTKGDVWGAARAATLVMGLAVTTSGFAVGRFSSRRKASSKPAPESETVLDTALGSAQLPVAVVDPDAPSSWRGPLAILDYTMERGQHTLELPGPAFTRARLLVFADGAPRGLVDVPDLAVLRDPEALRTLASSALTPPWTPAPWAGTSVPGGVSIVVPTKGRPTLLGRCVASLLAQTHPEFEVLVVDNNADTTESLAALDGLLSDSRLTLLHQPIGGSSEARNLGLLNARYDLVAATDDDVIADPDWLVRVTTPFSDPKVGCVTGLVIPESIDTWAQELFEQYGGFGKGFQARFLDLGVHRDPNPLFPFTAGTFGSGNNVAYRRDLVRGLGGYDSRLGPGSRVRAGQDLDLFLAVVFEGHTIAYEPAAVIRHHHRDTHDALRRQIYNYGRGLSAVISKWALSDPRRFGAVLVRLPRGLTYLLSPSSGKNAEQASDYPKDLRNAELKGLAAGWAILLRAGRRSPLTDSAKG